jgi:hypothetical protein
MMTHTINADEHLNALAERAPSEKLLSATQPGKAEPSAKQDEQDDGVEALIVHLDRTTAEHLFLQAQRDIRREAARALLEKEH